MLLILPSSQPDYLSVMNFQALNSLEAVAEEEENIVDAEPDEGDGDATETKRRKNQEEEVISAKTLQVLSTAL